MAAWRVVVDPPHKTSNQKVQWRSGVLLKKTWSQGNKKGASRDKRVEKTGKRSSTSKSNVPATDFFSEQVELRMKIRHNNEEKV